MPLKLAGGSHRRYNPLEQSWVLVSEHRLGRPWQGEQTPAAQNARPQYDPSCYLCPGNTRANGERNPKYGGTFAFDNDYPALQMESQGCDLNERGLLVAQPEAGRCRVVCFTPRHDRDIPSMQLAEVHAVIDTWAAETQVLAASGLSNVTVFENRGAAMGASNPHPHSQIWATAHAPSEIERERAGFARHAEHHGGTCLLCEYAQLERGAERIVAQNEAVCAVVPFWASWPFEVLVVPNEHVARLDACDAALREAFAHVMQAVTRKYDALFGAPFPYSMGWHQDGHLHAHYFPPLLRSATVRKFMVGYEMLGEPQRDLTAESAAQRLRAL